MANTSAAAPEGRHLLDYVRVLLKRLWLVVGVFTVVVAVVGFATWRTTPQYRATAVIDIRQPSTVLGKLDPTELIQSASNSQLYLNTRYALLGSRSTIETMMEKKGLDKWPEFQGKSAQEIARSLAGNISVDPERDTTLVRVSVVDPRNRIVHKITNALVDTFAEIQAKEQKSSVEETLAKLESRWIGYGDKVDLIRSQRIRMLEQNNMDLSTFLERFDYLQERLRSQQELVDQTDREINEKKAIYEKIVSVVEKGGEDALASLYGLSIVMRDGTVLQIEEELLQLRRDMQDLESRGKGENSPEVVALKSEISDREARRDFRKQMILRGFKQDYENLVDTRDNYVRQLEDIEESYRTMAAMKREYDQQELEIARWQAEATNYNTIWQKLQTTRTDEWKPVVVKEYAQQPFAPFKPDKTMNMILAIVFGLLGGIGIAFFLEYLDDTVKTKEELQKITNVPLFGVIPNMVARRGDTSKKDLYAYSQPKSTISEAFRGIRTAISYSSQKQENRVYLVTSSGPKEGKTTIGINVATVMAYSGTRTLIVDADLRKPRIHKSFDLPNTKGLTNLIIGDVAVEDVVQPTNIDNLFVLPSGPIPPNPSELLGRPRMQEILEELRERYDRVLLDTPPIGAVTDAAVLGRIVDSVILVVHAGKTRKKLIERGLEQLNQIDVDVSGIVLNNLKIGRKRYYPGYYHYYYYYSSYYGAEEKPKSRDKSRQQA